MIESKIVENVLNENSAQHIMRKRINRDKEGGKESYFITIKDKTQESYKILSFLNLIK